MLFRSLIKVKVSAGDAYSAVDKLRAVCKEKAAREKDHRPRGKRRKTPESPVFRETVRRVSVSIMARRQALEKMLSSGYNFWMYIDKDTGLFTVLYQRDDGSTGVIHPIFE